MEHFVKNTKSSKENPTLLLLDNDTSRLSLEALDIAKANGVTLLTLSPHTSHKTQPLDVAVFSPFRTYYDNAMRNWIMANPGKKVTMHHVSSFVKTAMEKAMTPGTILAGFRKCGIFPYNPDVFTEADFLAAAPFKKPDDNTPTPDEAAASGTGTSSATTTPPSSVGATPSTSAATSTDVCQEKTQTESGRFVGPYAIRALPSQQEKAPTPGSRQNRRKGRSMIPTDTPEKQQLEAQKAAANARRSTSSGRGKRTISRRRAVVPAAKKTKTKTKIPSTSSEDEEDVDDVVPLADSDTFMTWGEDEDTGPTVVDPNALGELSRAPKEEGYVLLRREQIQKSKKLEVIYTVAKVLTEPNEHGCVQVSLLTNKPRAKDKFSTCDPAKIETISVKDNIVMLLPKPNVGTKRQHFSLSFNVDFSLIRLTV
ncbi:Protein TOPAZ1 [Frankliniella fusca]|uniref:Protein TOPAZ1 n=1 Tax=Frankliniella fusca TaxID=407009 RepID=A0AAE1L5I6_9NEOP|nr:Protein TOPAZ1 [Frankliniella fusca]